ncbi:DNA phosphorothioation-dependent restriction protein DptG [Macrococcoides goetzii]|uniref:DNA phosphorothioation-dependent restriction protein DptG n=1 Tax=Macrococcus sp. PK TaxID=2801919 RepID=UPI001F0F4408|nr:DNA phosphorothioation-dependent restriction protein DptG [Macrococcus sp. PK]MCH4984493.1 DNA phosphorothioation-dependent restriction protein DptG [Macrococcus sp. PK]
MSNLATILAEELKITSGKAMFKGLSPYKIFPFHTREPERAKFTNGFDPVLGVIARGSLGYKESYSLADYDISSIVDEVEVEDDSINDVEKEKLINAIFDYSHLDSLKHPYLLNYKTLSEGNESKGEVDLGGFLIELFQLQSDETWKKFIGDKEPSNLIEKILLESLGDLPKEQSKNKFKAISRNLFPHANEDLHHLLRYKDFALKNINLFFSFYYFQYIIQNAISADRINKTEMKGIFPLYYTLENENITGTRETNKHGYNIVKEIHNNLLIDERLVGYLNLLVDDDNFYSITEMLNFEGEKASQFNNELYIFMSLYKTNINKREDLSQDTESLIKLLKKWLLEDLSKETMSRYFKSIEEIGNKYFLKNRGKLGKVLTLKNEFIILLTAICIKEDKMIIKELFNQFERRGVYLDRYSKEKIVELFDKMNILDKKSDSGEAIYVKSIL